MSAGEWGVVLSAFIGSLAGSVAGGMVIAALLLVSGYRKRGEHRD